MPVHTGASTAVLTYLREHANLAIPYQELHKAINANARYTVPNAVQHLMTKGFPIERPMRGTALYREIPHADPPSEPASTEIAPEPPPTWHINAEAPLYEFVGQSGGIIVVRNVDNDELYRLAPLMGE